MSKSKTAKFINIDLWDIKKRKYLSSLDKKN